MTITLILLAVALFWAACSVLSYRGSRTYCQTEYPACFETEKEQEEDRMFHGGLAITSGPIYLAILVVGGYFKHGFSVTPEVDHDYEAARDAWESEERAKADVDDQYEAAQADWEANERWKE